MLPESRFNLNGIGLIRKVAGCKTLQMGTNGTDLRALQVITAWIKANFLPLSGRGKTIFLRLVGCRTTVFLRTVVPENDYEFVHEGDYVCAGIV